MTIEPTRAGWSIGDSLLALAAGIGGGLVAAVALAVATGGAEATLLQQLGVVAVAQSLVTVAVVYRTVRRKGSGDVAGDLGLGFRWQDLIGIPGGLLLQIVLALTLLPIIELFDIDQAPQEIVRETEEATGFTVLVAIVVIGFVAPIAEEIMFRGMLLRALLARYRRVTAILISAVVFSAIHLLDPGAVLVVPQLFMVGVVLAWIAERRGSLGLPIVLHMGFNLTAVAALLLIEG